MLINTTPFYVAAGGGGISSPTIYNPAYKNSDMNLIGDYTASWSGSGIGSVQTLFGASTGKYYMEYTMDSFGSNVNNFMGMTFSPSGASTIVPGNTAGSWGYFGNYVRHSGVNKTGVLGGKFSTGEVVSTLLDLDNQTILWWRNGTNVTGTHALAETVGLTWYLGIAMYNDMPAVSTANFGQSPFVYTPPVGFTAGFGV